MSQESKLKTIKDGNLDGMWILEQYPREGGSLLARFAMQTAGWMQNLNGFLNRLANIDPVN